MCSREVMEMAQTSMFEPTAEEAAANLRGFWEQLLGFEFGMVVAAEGVEMPPGMVPELARIMALNRVEMGDEQLGAVLLLMSQAYEAGVLYERRHGSGAGCGGR